MNNFEKPIKEITNTASAEGTVNSNFPSKLVTTPFVLPLIIILAPGMGPPLLSVIVPVIVF